MLNRKIVVDVVKKDKASSDEPGHPESTFEDKAMIVANVIEHGIRKVTLTMVVYITLDTVRKIAVASASR